MNKELREKITKEQAIYNLSIYLQTDGETIPPGFKSSLKLALKLLALFDEELKETIKDDADRCAGYKDGWIEEAKKEERERIIKEIEEHLSIQTDDNGIFISGYIAGEKWQALKKDK